MTPYYCQIEHVFSDSDVGMLRQACRSEVRAELQFSPQPPWIVAAQVKIEVSGRFSIG